MRGSQMSSRKDKQLVRACVRTLRRSDTRRGPSGSADWLVKVDVFHRIHRRDVGQTGSPV